MFCKIPAQDRHRNCSANNGQVVFGDVMNLCGPGLISPPGGISASVRYICRYKKTACNQVELDYDKKRCGLGLIH